MFSALGRRRACHIEPDLQPGYPAFTIGRPAELERVGVRLPCPEFKDQSEVLALAC